MYSITGSFKATNSQFTNRLQGMGLDTIGHGLNNLDTLHGKYIFNVYGNNEKVIDYYTLYMRKIDEKYLHEILAKARLRHLEEYEILDLMAFFSVNIFLNTYFKKL